MATLNLLVRLRDQTRAGTRSLNRNLKGVGAQTQAIGRFSRLSGVALAGMATGALAGLGRLITTSLKTSDELQKLSQTTGISTEGLSRLRFAAEQSGTSLDVVVKAQRRLAANSVDAAMGIGDARVAFEELGINAKELAALEPEQQFAVLADAIRSVENPTQRLAYAQDILGRSGAELLPLLRGGSEGLRRLGEQAERTGNILSQQTADASARVNDTMNELRHTVSGLGQTIFEGLLPSLETAANAANYVVRTYRDQAQATDELELRKLRLARAAEEATLATTRLSFGAVELKGQYVDLDAALARVNAITERQTTVYGALRTASDNAGEGVDALGDEADETADQIDESAAAARRAISSYDRLAAAAGRARAIGPARYRAQQEREAEEERRQRQREQTGTAGPGILPEPIDTRPQTPVQGPHRPGSGVTRAPSENLDPRTPVLGSGGIVRRPTLAVVGDGGPEAVIPLPRNYQTGGGAGNGAMGPLILNLMLDERLLGRYVVEEVQRAANRGELTLEGTL